MPHDVFINYALADQLIAEKICDFFEAHHIRCWLAGRDLIPGSDPETSSIQALYESQLMIFIFSSYSNVPSSFQGLLIEKAVAKEIPIIILRLEDIEPLFEIAHLIDRSQWIEGQRPPSEKQLQKLFATSKTILGAELESINKKIISALRALAPYMLKAFLFLIIVGGSWVLYWGISNLYPLFNKTSDSDEGLCAVPPKLILVKTSFGELSETNSKFKPSNVLDDRADTAWMTKGQRGKEDEWIQLNFSKPLTIAKLAIINGCADPELFLQNGRAEKITIQFSSGKEYSLGLEDHSKTQFLRFTPSTTTFIRLAINSAYPGSASNNVCLAEIKSYAFCEQLR